MSAIEIFFASDNNYARHLLVAINSIVLNSKNANCNFYILDGGISNFYKNKIKQIADNVEFIVLDKSYTEKLPCPRGAECWGKLMYYRYFIPIIKPNLKKALYLDCDVAVTSSLKELWEINLENKYCAAVIDYNYKYSAQCAINVGVKNYFNSGVVLINNEKWANENVAGKLVDATNNLFSENKLIFPDQDAMNYVFKENIVFLNPKFNFQANANTEMDKEGEAPIIVHYNGGSKPWRNGYEFFPDAYLIPLYKAGFKKEYFKIKLNHIIWKVLQTIFDVRNEYINNQKYKRITILGIRFKIRAQRL